MGQSLRWKCVATRTWSLSVSWNFPRLDDSDKTALEAEVDALFDEFQRTMERYEKLNEESGTNIRNTAK